MVNMFGATEFAKRCDVSVQTVSNWVKRGFVRPTQSVNGRNYFSEDCIAQVKMKLLRGLTDQSYLGIMVADDETAVTEITSRFIQVVSSALPDALCIGDLHKYLASLSSIEGKELSQQGDRSFRVRLCDRFQKAVISMMFSVMSETALALSKCREWPIDFFCSVMMDSDPDEALLAEWQGMNIVETRHTPAGLRSACELRYNDLVRKYGLASAFIKLGISLRDVYFGDFKGLEDAEDAVVDIEEDKAKTVYKAFLQDTVSRSSRKWFTDLKKNGYYTIINGVGSLSRDDQARIVTALTYKDYANVFLNSRNNVPDAIMTVIESCAKAGDINLVILDDPN